MTLLWAEYDDQDLQPFSPARLRLARQRRRLRQRALAERVSCTPSAISRFERGDLVPSVAMVERLSVALDFPFGFFYLDEDEDRALAECEDDLRTQLGIATPARCSRGSRD